MARRRGGNTGSITPGRRERRSAETREKLFRAAMSLFAERGFFETTTEDITRAADVGEGTFFNYFPSKQHVLLALFEIQIGKLEAARDCAEAESVPIQKVLHELMQRIGEEPGRSPALTRSLLIAFLSSDAVREAAGTMLGRARRELKAIITLGQQRGEIRRTLRAADLAATYQKRVLGTMLFFALGECSLAVELNKTFKEFWAEAHI